MLTSTRQQNISEIRTKKGHSRTRIKGIEEILFPMSKEDFFNNYWEKKPLLISREDEDYFSDLFSIKTIDKLFSRKDLFYPEVRVFQEGAELPADKFTCDWVYGSDEYKGIIDIEKILDLYSQGATFDFRLIERFHKPMMLLCKKLEQQIGFAVDASAFLTPFTSVHHIQAHHDIVDGLILQVGGVKRWKVWRNRYEKPMIEDKYFERTANPKEEDLVGEFILYPGDTLYVPSGFVHLAEPVNDFSLHVTLAIHTPRWNHLFLKLARDILEELQDDPRFRKSLPLQLKDDSSRIFRESSEQSFSELLNEFSKRLDFRRGIKMIRQNLLVGSYPSRPGQILDIANIGSLNGNSRLHIRDTIVSSISESEKKIQLEFQDKVLSFPQAISDAIRFVSSGNSFLVKEIPGLADMSSQLILVKRLVKEGFLTTISSK